MVIALPNIFKTISGNFTSTKILAPLLIALLILSSIISFMVGKVYGSNQSQILLQNNQKLGPAKAALTLNHESSFPVKNQDGKEIGKFRYLIDGSELRDQIIVQGQKATAVEGKSFLILNIKIANDTKEEISLNSRDFLRVNTKGNKEALASDVHSDPVIVQPISTKRTRLGFIVDEDTKDFIINFGDINGEKKTINLDFKK